MILQQATYKCCAHILAPPWSPFMRKARLAHLAFVMEKRGADFHVSARGQLATKKFPNADWTAETIDADGDDYDEVLFTGADASGPNPRHRLILYVPENRHMYVLEFEKQ